ncbi:MAG: hypothetical protein AAF408_18515, partial [Pseudomonadota bacterium]
AAQEGVTSILPDRPVEPIWLVMGSAFFFHGFVFVWQTVGVLRAAERHLEGSGQMFGLWGAQLALIVAAFWVLSYSLEAWHLTQNAEIDDIPSQAELKAERAARYNLTLSPDGRALEFEGSLELGVTARLKEMLDTLPPITEVRLSSSGGNIYEARGLAAIIRRRGLGTVVVSECSSACTTAFIAGTTRRMARKAKLGFHQYRIDADYAVLFADIDTEQERDLAAYRESGVEPWFLDKVYQRDASEMWYPAISELLDANVVTEVIDRSGEQQQN